jgi:hypothetical protein
MQSARFAHATLIQALTAAEAEVAAFFASLSEDEFVLRQGAAWSPAGHLAHLNISVSATARALSIPKLLLRFRFGRRFVPAPETVAGAAGGRAARTALPLAARERSIACRPDDLVGAGPRSAAAPASTPRADHGKGTGVLHDTSRATSHRGRKA